MKATFLVLACALLGACASVEPWERDRLAREEMAFEPDPQAQAIRDLTYASKEAASGGAGVGGGGCGCN